MKKRLALALFGLLCGSAFAQTNTAPPASAQPTQNSPAATSQAEPTTTGVVGGHNAAYTDRIPPEQMIMLDASGDKFQARHIADLSGQPRGAVIILHDSGQHPTWPFTAAALIDDLPLHGWDTLNIELPTPSTETTKPTTEPTKSGTSAQATTPAAASNSAPAAGVNAATPTPTTTAGIEAQTQARISTAIKYFSDQKQRNIALIGFGSGAIRAAETVRLIAAANPATPGSTASAATTAPITALLMIAPQQQLSGIEMDLPKLLPLTGVPALDMRFDNEPQARAEAEARRRAVLHQRGRIYTRIEMSPIDNTSDAQHSAMVKRVRAWLQVNAQAAH